jgi:hypothetical protein
LEETRRCTTQAPPSAAPAPWTTSSTTPTGPFRRWCSLVACHFLATAYHRQGTAGLSKKRRSSRQGSTQWACAGRMCSKICANGTGLVGPLGGFSGAAHRFAPPPPPNPIPRHAWCLALYRHAAPRPGRAGRRITTWSEGLPGVPLSPITQCAAWVILFQASTVTSSTRHAADITQLLQWPPGYSHLQKQL